MNKVRVRFAPSPTGYMHVGNFRTALYAYLFAKKNSGDFILRIEDTDQKRYVQDALEKLIDIINWAGFEYSEGVFIENGKVIQKGDFGPYIQSERLELYKKHASELVENGTAYRCFCTPQRLEEMRNQQQAEKKAPMYDRCCLALSKEEIENKIANGEAYVIRQKINAEGFTEYNDLIRGKVSIKNELLDDQILMKSDGYPTYNFANVVDDHLMEITHVIRGEEYVSSTPKYVQLYQNFGWNVPQFAHLPLLLNPDKSKLSKRQGDVAVEDYIKNGYLKEAIINFVALLGWNPGEGETQEIFSLEELIQKFDFSHVHKGGAVFDVKKLNWINSEWIKKISDDKNVDELYKRSKNFWEQKDFYKQADKYRKSEEYIKNILKIERDRLTNLSEVGESNKFFFQDIEYSKELLTWKNMSNDRLIQSLQTSKKVLETVEWNMDIDITSNNINTGLNNNLAPSQLGDTIEISEKELVESGFKTGELYWPLRVALTGEKKSPPPGEVAAVLGKDESLRRIKKALELF